MVNLKWRNQTKIVSLKIIFRTGTSLIQYSHILSRYKYVYYNNFQL